MSTEAKCPECGGYLPAGLPAGNCPACLLNIGLEPRSGTIETGPAGRVFGEYELQAQIGSGGMGIVFRAHNSKLKRMVALKMIRTGEFASSKEVERFKREAEAAASLDHPNIVPVYEVGEREGWHYLCLKLIQGTSLDRETLRYQEDPRATAILLAKVARAVHHAHQRGLLHRDLKPSNILLDQAGEPYVTDFGLAKRVGQDAELTLTGQMVGTPAYMAPEQAQGPVLTTAADIYSLGVIFYELLTGEVPFRGQTPWDTLRQAVEKDPKPPGALQPGIDRDLETICLRCLSKEPAQRYGSAEALAEELERWLRHEPILARPSGVWSRSVKWTRRHPATAALLVVLIVGFGVSAWQAIRATRAEQNAARHAAGEAANRAQAEKSAAEARKTVAQMDFVEAGRLIEQEKNADAMAYLVRCLRSNPKHHGAVILLSRLMVERSWMFHSLEMKHSDAVWAAEFSPDGSRIVTASMDATARVWDARTGQPVTPPLKHTNRVYSARFSPDGTRVVTAAWDHTARVWDARTGEPLIASLYHSGNVWSARFSPDGKQILTAGMDGLARIWDAQSGAALVTVRHAGGVSSAEFSADGARIVTTSHDKTARVWDARSGLPISPPLKHNGWVDSARFGPNATNVVTASEDFTARIWDVATGRALTPAMVHRAPVWKAEFSPDGKSILTASEDTTARLWDATTGKALAPPLAHSSWVRTGRFSPDGKRVVTASYDGTARLWNAGTNRLTIEPLKDKGGVCSASFSPDGMYIVTANRAGTAHVWDTHDGSGLPVVLRHRGRVLSGVFNQDGRQVATGGEDGSARIWDARSGRALVAPMEHGVPVTSIAFSPDGKHVATGAQDFTVRVWDASTGLLTAGALFHTNVIRSICFDPDSRCLISASDDGTARVWDVHTGAPLLPPIRHKDAIYAARFSPDGRRIITGSDDGTACVWNARTGEPIAGITHQSPVRWAQFSPDGKRVVTSSWDTTARVWDPETGKEFVPPFKHSGWPEAVDFSPDGRKVVTADNVVRVWDTKSGRLLAAHTPDVFAGMLFAQFSPDEHRILTVGRDLAVQILDLETGQRLMHRDGVISARFSPDGTRMLAVSDHGPARIWDIAPPPDNYPGWLLELAEGLSGRMVNRESALMDLPGDATGTINRLRHRFDQSTEKDPWTIWGRWFFADRRKRTISPFSTQTVAEHIEDLIAAATIELREAPLDEAKQLSLGNAEVQRRIADARRPFELRRQALRLIWKRECREAVAPLKEAIELLPGDYEGWGCLALVLAVDGNIAEYEKVRSAMLARFGSTTEARIANPVSRPSMLFPVSDPEMAVVARLSRLAVEAGTMPGPEVYAQDIAPLCEYRQGSFGKAIECARDFLSKPARHPHLKVQVGSVLAMAYYRMGNSSDAQTVLRNTQNAYNAELPGPNLSKVRWQGDLMCEIILREATELIEGQTALSTPARR